MEGNNFSQGTKIQAAICKHCPACKQARKNPESFFGRVLNIKHHADNCPAWKAYKEVYEK